MTKRRSDLEIVFKLLLKKVALTHSPGRNSRLSVFGCSRPQCTRNKSFSHGIRKIFRRDPNFHLMTGNCLTRSTKSRRSAPNVFTVTNRNVETLFLSQISCPERKRVKAKSLHNVSQRNSCRRFINRSRD